MYKCKECGTEYDIKPDYCDCGNDEFEEFAVKENSAKEETVVLTDTTAETKDIKTNPKPASSISSKQYNPPPQKRTFAEKYPVLSRFIQSLDPISLTVFCICVFLSFYVIFFMWNPVENAEQEVKQTEVVQTKNIPSIDKLWNSTPPAVQKTLSVKQEELTPVEVTVNSIKPIIPAVKLTEQNKTIVPTQKVSNTPKTTTVQLKKTTTNKQATTVQTQVQAKTQKTAEDVAKQNAEAERKQAEAEQIKKLQAEQAKKLAEQKSKQAQQAKQELITYKAKLRNTLAKKIDFTKVIGDGDCTVAFKIDSNGKLIKRSFAKQSSNNTLNDAVYAAIMATPSFSPPPQAYNNETLNLYIKFYNGNFEISLP